MTGVIDRKAFFDDVRVLYGGNLTQAQVDAMDHALTAWEHAFREQDVGEEASTILTKCWIEGVSLQTLSDQGAQVLVDREGLRLDSYQDSVGVWTIGVGHSEYSPNPPQPVGPGMTITEEEAYEILKMDDDTFEQVVRDNITRPMAQHQFDAFVSIAFNIGGGAFAGATFVQRFNAGESDQNVAEAILFWNKPPEIIPRRQGEAHQFRDGVYLARVDPMPPAVGV